MRTWRPVNIFCPLIVCLILLVPGFSHGDDKPGKSSPYSVQLRPFAEGEKEKYGLEIVHPYSFDLQIIRKSMASLAYQTKALGWSDKKRVFPPSAVEVLSPQIVERFAQADAGRRVVFRVKNRRGKTALAGDVFLTPDGLNWRFTAIGQSEREVDDFSVAGDFWRLVPLKGQTYKTKSPHKNLTQNITNWIMLTDVRPDPSRPTQSPPEREGAGKAPAAEDAGVKRRLKLLEELKLEGLIREDEYETKRKEILKLL